MSQLFEAGRQRLYARAASNTAVNGADAFKNVNKKNMRDVLSVYDKTVNLKGTEFMLQIQTSRIGCAAQRRHPLWTCDFVKLTSVT